MQSSNKSQRATPSDSRQRGPAAIQATPWTWQIVAGLILAVAGIACYYNSFGCPQIFDGIIYIQLNPSLKKIWPWEPLFGQNRPVGFFSVALNAILHDDHVWGYHATNLAIHVTVAWLLFGIVRRTLVRGRLADRHAADAWGLALAVSLVWLVHPLQTESVTYIYQRLESLMGMFYLATLWCFIVSLDSKKPGWWQAASVACCALGMGTKESMVTAPLLVLWYDRAIAAENWREVFSRRGKYYVALAGSWAVLATLMFLDRQSYSQAGLLNVTGISPLDYALSQPGVILHYLQLSFWPDRLCLDYGWPVAERMDQIVPPAIAIGTLVLLTLWAAYRWPAWGFLGGAFFLTLAPTSSVAPIKDLAFEHRMYLPLAAVAALAIMLIYECWRVLTAPLRGAAGRPSASVRIVAALMLVAIASGLGYRTVLRNRDYASELSIWQVTAEERPQCARAHANLGKALAADRNFHDAVAELRTSIELDPSNSDSHWMLGGFLRSNRQDQAAVEAYTKAIEIHEHSPEAATRRSGNFQLSTYYIDRAEARAKLNDNRNALVDCNAAIRLAPVALWYYKRACIYGLLREFKPAAEDFSHTLDLEPNNALAYFGRAESKSRLGREAEAIRDYSAAVRLQPNNPEFRRVLQQHIKLNQTRKNP